MSPRLAATLVASTLASFALAMTASADPTGTAWTRDAMGWTGIFKMSSAPFPHPSRGFTDNRVMLFVPDGFRSGPTVDLVIHYHGHRNEIVNSDKGHRYREQAWLSKKNIVLVQPQGPVYASDSAGGKHEDTNGLKKFVAEVISVLARDGVVPNGATLGRLALSGHSGAYRVMGRGIVNGGLEVSEVYLHDGLYGEIDTFEKWAKKPGHRFVSTTTRNGGTWTNNENLKARLQAAGLTVAGSEEPGVLAGNSTFVIKTDVAHDPACYQRLRWAAHLEHGGLADLGCARPRLRSVRGTAPGTVEVSWYASRSKLLRGYRLYGSTDASGPFTLVHNEQVLGAAATTARVSGAGDQCYRVVAVDDRGQESAPSNVYAARYDDEARTRVLVVDGFVRMNAAWKAYDHAFGALVAASSRAAGRGVDSCRATAVTDGSVKLADYASVVWLAGDQSVEDAALTGAEQKALTAYLARGGTLLVSGSEIGYALGTGSASAEDRAFFANTLHAVYAADSNTGRLLSGAGTTFAGLSVPFGGTTAPYAPRTPDVLSAGSSASAVLKYGDGRGAAIGYEGLVGAGTSRSGVLTAGFPVETADGAVARDALVARALEWMDGVNRRAGR